MRITAKKKRRNLIKRQREVQATQAVHAVRTLKAPRRLVFEWRLSRRCAA